MSKCIGEWEWFILAPSPKFDRVMFQCAALNKDGEFGVASGIIEIDKIFRDRKDPHRVIAEKISQCVTDKFSSVTQVAFSTDSAESASNKIASAILDPEVTVFHGDFK